DAGVSVWLLDLSRTRLVSGNLADLVAPEHVRGVTTNPSIFATAIRSGGGDYAGQLADLAARGVGLAQAMQDLTGPDQQQLVAPPCRASPAVPAPPLVLVDDANADLGAGVSQASAWRPARA